MVEVVADINYEPIRSFWSRFWHYLDLEFILKYPPLILLITVQLKRRLLPILSLGSLSNMYTVIKQGWQRLGINPSVSYRGTKEPPVFEPKKREKFFTTMWSTVGNVLNSTIMCEDIRLMSDRSLTKFRP